MQFAETLDPILQFLSAIHAPHKVRSLSQDTFLPGLQIEAGVLLIDPDQLGSPGDILHEMGHLAVAPERLRGHLNGDVDACVKAMGQDEGLCLSSEEINQLQMSESMAIAWSYAAALGAGIDPDSVFWGQGYGGAQGGSPRTVLMQVAHGFFPGIHALAQARLCVSPPPFGDGLHPHPFPKMRRWIAA